MFLQDLRQNPFSLQPAWKSIAQYTRFLK